MQRRLGGGTPRLARRGTAGAAHAEERGSANKLFAFILSLLLAVSLIPAFAAANASPAFAAESQSANWGSGLTPSTGKILVSSGGWEGDLAFFNGSFSTDRWWVETDFEPTSYSDLVGLDESCYYRFTSTMPQAKGGRYYTWVSHVKPNNAETISSDIKVTIGTYGVANIEIMSDGLSGYVWKTYGPTDEAIVVDTIAIEDVTAPVAGLSPDFTYSVTSVGGKGASAGRWYETDFEPTSHSALWNGKLVKPGDDFTFQAGKYYSFWAYVYNADGYAISTYATATLNGKTAGKHTTGNDVWYCFGQLEEAEEPGTEHVHHYVYDSSVANTETFHSLKCDATEGVCDEPAKTEAHSGGTATCKSKAVCAVCGESYGSLDPDNHESAAFDYADNNDGTHSKKHECCGKVATAAEEHDYSAETGKCVCGAKKSTVEYVLTKGNGQTVVQGDKANFVSNAPFEKFSKVLVDGTEVPATNYVAVSGSTDVTFNDTYTAALSEGEHTIAIVSEDGQADGKFTVKTKSVEPETDPAVTPGTDNSGSDSSDKKFEPEKIDNGDKEFVDPTADVKNDSKASSKGTMPATGDSLPIVPLIVVILASLAVLGILAALRKRDV